MKTVPYLFLHFYISRVSLCEAPCPPQRAQPAAPVELRLPSSPRRDCPLHLQRGLGLQQVPGELLPVEHDSHLREKQHLLL